MTSIAEGDVVSVYVWGRPGQLEYQAHPAQPTLSYPHVSPLLLFYALQN